MAGGWFFLMINEAFTLGNRDFRLPGLGSYMSVAASQGDVPSMINAVIAMIILIVFLDQVLWRPLVVWSQKLRVEETTSFSQTNSWFLNILNNVFCSDFFLYLFRRMNQILQDRKARNPRKLDFGFFALITSRLFLCILFALLVLAAFFVIRLVKDVSIEQWLYLSKMLMFTFFRVLFCIIISVIIMLPLGLTIGLSEKYSRTLQPIIQITASFPATLLFPVLILIFKMLGISLGIGSIILMLMGTQWYILFNVMAGVKAMPSDLKEVAKSFSFNRPQRFLWLHLPAVFPYLITGILSAAGGAWNASIVAEYATYKGQIWTTPGIGSSISLAAQNNDYPLLAAGILVMVAIVVILNYQVWLKLYHYSEKRFALNV
jgi:NitT/TauT family transport system permease protein